MDRASIGDFQQPRTLRLIERSFDRDVAVDHRQCDIAGFTGHAIVGMHS